MMETCWCVTKNATNFNKFRHAAKEVTKHRHEPEHLWTGSHPSTPLQLRKHANRALMENWCHVWSGQGRLRSSETDKKKIEHLQPNSPPPHSTHYKLLENTARTHDLHVFTRVHWNLDIFQQFPECRSLCWWAGTNHGRPLLACLDDGHLWQWPHWNCHPLTIQLYHWQNGQNKKRNDEIVQRMILIRNPVSGKNPGFLFVCEKPPSKK